MKLQAHVDSHRHCRGHSTHPTVCGAKILVLTILADRRNTVLERRHRIPEIQGLTSADLAGAGRLGFRVPCTHFRFRQNSDQFLEPFHRVSSHCFLRPACPVKSHSINRGKMLATLNLQYLQPGRSLFHRGADFDNRSLRSGPLMHGPDSGCSVNSCPPGIIGVFFNI